MKQHAGFPDQRSPLHVRAIIGIGAAEAAGDFAAAKLRQRALAQAEISTDATIFPMFYSKIDRDLWCIDSGP